MSSDTADRAPQHSTTASSAAPGRLRRLRSIHVMADATAMATAGAGPPGDAVAALVSANALAGKRALVTGARADENASLSR